MSRRKSALRRSRSVSRPYKDSYDSSARPMGVASQNSTLPCDSNFLSLVASMGSRKRSRIRPFCILDIILNMFFLHKFFHYSFTQVDEAERGKKLHVENMSRNNVEFAPLFYGTINITR